MSPTRRAPSTTLRRKTRAKNARIVFHSDGVQAFGKLPVRLTKDIDLYTSARTRSARSRARGRSSAKGYTALCLFTAAGRKGAAQRHGERVRHRLFLLCRQEKFASMRRTVPAGGYKERSGRARSCAFRASRPRAARPISSRSARGKRGRRCSACSGQGVAVGTGSACNSKKPHSRVLEACGYAPVLDGVLRVSFCPRHRGGRAPCSGG